MEAEYDLSKLKSRKNPYAEKLKAPVSSQLSEDVYDLFKEITGQASLTKRKGKR